MSLTTTTAPDTAGSRSAHGALLAVMLPAVLMAILDVAITNVAIPSIGADLHAAGAELQLVIGGYIVAYAVTLICGARLGDRYGHRFVFLVGVTAFTAASLACGLAWSAIALVCFRLVQGLGAAFMVPQVISLIQLHFSGPARSRALGWYGAVIAGGAILGQILGGVLVDADLLGSPWRSVFLVNVPIGLAVVVGGQRRLPHDTGDTARRLDLPGLVALAVAVLALVLPLVLGRELGWPAWTWASLAGSVTMLIIFVQLERRATRLDRSPLVSGRLMRTPGLAVGAVAIFAALANYSGILFLLSLHLQAGLGYRPLVAGLVFLPSAVAFAVTSLNWRRLPEHWHRRMIPIGLLASSAALVGVAATLRSGHLNVGMELSILLFGAGMGFAFSPLFALALAHVPPAHAADASGVLSTVNQLGQVVGIAAYGSEFLSLFHTRAASPHAATVTALTMSIGGVIAALAAFALPSNK